MMDIVLVVKILELSKIKYNRQMDSHLPIFMLSPVLDFIVDGDVLRDYAREYIKCI